MKQEAARLDWVDAVRGIGIVLVVFGHVWRGLWQAQLLTDAPLFHAVDTAIYLFHMPLFFLVSGLFFERSVHRDGARLSILKRCETLLFPLLIWSWILAAFLLIAGSFTSRDALTPMDALLYPFPPKDIFWFLWALFLIQLMSLALVWMPRPVLVAIFLLSFVAALVQPGIPATALLDGAIANLPFFLAGMLIQRFDFFEVRQTAQTSAVGAVIFALSIWCAIAYGLQPAPLGTLLSLVAALSFCATIYGFAPGIPRRPMQVATYLGATSMAIYVMHVEPAAAIRIVLVRLGVETVWLQLVVGTLAGILVPLLAYAVLKRLGLLRAFGLGRDRTPQRYVLSPS